MAMSDTEMALMMGANQLAAMRPVNPGAFSGIEAGMMPPGMQMPMQPMPMPPAAPTGQMAAPNMPMPPTNAPMPQDQAGMMQYIQEKAKQIRERMGQGQASDADMGALEAVMKAMPQPQSTGAMSNREMQMMQSGAR